MFSGLRQWFDSGRRDRAVLGALHQLVIAEARDPALYQPGLIPDTPTGRFEAVTLHLGLVVLACRAGESIPGPRHRLTTRLFHRVVAELERDLTEMGMGDSSLSKKMNKLSAVMTGRIRSLNQALAADDDHALADLLGRTVLAEAPPDGQQPQRLAMVIRTRTTGPQALALLARP